MRKFFGSSLFWLSLLAILAGAIGALLSGIWDPLPADGVFSYGSYFYGAKSGALWASICLVPYWVFHAVVGDIFVSWEQMKNKLWRVAWVICWAGVPSWLISLGLAV